MMGNTRQAVNRQLRDFEEQELIGRRRGSLTILDRSGLEEAAQSEVQ